jgi:BirA family biotin operon repressor/biotin-[acetyl-CoA-carboxylase] ligase
VDQKTLEKDLAGLPLGPLRYFDRIGSTNDEASRWADTGAPDLALVVAGEQTAGRGRGGRKWFTPPEAALAFSLVLRDLTSASPETIPWTTALGALAVSQALHDDYGLQAQIKWPNDVLLERRKVAGVLAEAHWVGDQLSAVILGIGINVAPSAVPADSELIFPATCIEAALGHPLERTSLLRSVLAKLLEWRTQLGTPEFLRAWEESLAFQGEWVYAIIKGQAGAAHRRQGLVLGLDPQGQIKLRDRSGEIFSLRVGEIRLRPLEGSAREEMEHV